MPKPNVTQNVVRKTKSNRFQNYLEDVSETMWGSSHSQQNHLVILGPDGMWRITCLNKMPCHIKKVYISVNVPLPSSSLSVPFLTTFHIYLSMIIFIYHTFNPEGFPWRFKIPLIISAPKGLTFQKQYLKIIWNGYGGWPCQWFDFSLSTVAPPDCIPAPGEVPSISGRVFQEAWQAAVRPGQWKNSVCSMGEGPRKIFVCSQS